jgi:hypothetical protein
LNLHIFLNYRYQWELTVKNVSDYGLGIQQKTLHTCLKNALERCVRDESIGEAADSSGAPTVDVESIGDGIALHLDIPLPYGDYMSFTFPLSAVAREPSGLLDSLMRDYQDEIDALKAGVGALKEDNAAIKSKVAALCQENDVLRENNLVLHKDNVALKNDVAVLKTQISPQLISLRQSTICGDGDFCTWGKVVVNTAESLFQLSSNMKTITVNTSGIYRVTARVPGPSEKGSEWSYIDLQINGITMADGYSASASSKGYVSTCLTEVLDIVAADQLSVYFSNFAGDDSHSEFTLSVLTIEKLN